MGRKEREKRERRRASHANIHRGENRRSTDIDRVEIDRFLAASMPRIEEDILVNVRANSDKKKLLGILKSLRNKGEDYTRPAICGFFIQMMAYAYFDRDAQHRDAFAEDVSNGMRTAAGMIRAVGRELHGVSDVYFRTDETSTFFKSVVRDAAVAYEGNPTALMDYIVDKMKSPEWLSAQSQLDGRFIVHEFLIAGAELARKVYGEVYPLTGSLQTN